jgi:hypothetical protein
MFWKLLRFPTSFISSYPILPDGESKFYGLLTKVALCKIIYFSKQNKTYLEILYFIYKRYSGMRFGHYLRKK